MKINETLKPCPFCGSEAQITRLDMSKDGVTLIEVSCSCGAEVRFDSDDCVYSWDGTAYQTGLTAIEKWNRRAEHDND